MSFLNTLSGNRVKFTLGWLLQSHRLMCGDDESYISCYQLNCESIWLLWWYIQCKCFDKKQIKKTLQFSIWKNLFHIDSASPEQLTKVNNWPVASVSSGFSSGLVVSGAGGWASTFRKCLLKKIFLETSLHGWAFLTQPLLKRVVSHHQPHLQGEFYTFSSPVFSFFPLYFI